MTEARRSAIVIGAGIVGVSSALHLQRQGFQVTMVDRLAPGQGTSFGNAGVLGPSSVVPVPTPGIIKKIPKLLFDPRGPLFLRWSYLPKFIPWSLSFLASSRPQKVAHISQNLAALLGDCVEQHQELSRGTKAARWVQPCSYLFLFTDRQAFESDAYIWDLRREHGARWDTLEGDQLGDLVPGLGPKYRFAVLVKDHGMITNPGAYVNDLAEHFAAQGGTIERAEVTAVDGGGDDGVRLGTTNGPLAADTLVVAAGAWSHRLAKQLGVKIPLESERGYHVELQDPSVAPKVPVMVADGKFVVTPMSEGLRLAGLAEFGGLEAPASTRPIRLLLERARELFPGLTYSAHREWMGHRPSTPDSLPVIGPAPGRPNIFFAFGHQHVGLMSGAKTGRLVADLAAGGKPNIDLAAFRAERFAR
jgi:D-amino-acid dehydrogenase